MCEHSPARHDLLRLVASCGDGHLEHLLTPLSRTHAPAGPFLAHTDLHSGGLLARLEDMVVQILDRVNGRLRHARHGRHPLGRARLHCEGTLHKFACGGLQAVGQVPSAKRSDASAKSAVGRPIYLGGLLGDKMSICLLYLVYPFADLI